MGKFWWIFLLCSLFLVAEGAELKKFVEDGIVPDIMDVPPGEFLNVTYGSFLVTLGNELTPSQVRAPPTSVSFEAEPGKFYTLVMTDPDAPSRAQPIFRSWLHWLVGNIPGNDLASGEVLGAYTGAGPPKKMGLHRYVFTMYEQPQGKIKFPQTYRYSADRSQIFARSKFSLRDFLIKAKLKEPAVAGNYFLSQWEPTKKE